MNDAVKDYLKSNAEGQPLNLTAAMAKRKPNFDNVRPSDPHFVASIPPDHHEEALVDDGTEAVAYGRNALRELYEVHEKIINTALNVQNKAELAKQIEGTVAKTIEKMRAKLANLDTRIKDAGEAITKEVGMGMSPLSQEIRQHVKSLPENERFSFAREAVARYDATTIKALIAVPPYLSGLDADAYALVREMGEELIDSKSFKQRAGARAARAKVERALEHFETTMNGNLSRWKNGDDARIRDLMSSLTPKKENE